MIIALATPRFPRSVDEGLEKIQKLLSDASARRAEIVCFPEAYIPGLRGMGHDVLSFDRAQHDRVLAAVSEWTSKYAVAAILGMEKPSDEGPQIVSYVID